MCVYEERESKTLDNILVPLNEWVTSSALGGILCSEHLLQRKEREEKCVCVRVFVCVCDRVKDYGIK